VVVKCACGLEHGDGALLPKVGWQDLFDDDGGFGLLVNCPCKSTFCIRTVQNAALCAKCRRLITGEAGLDPKIYATDEGDSNIYCKGCALRLHVGMDPVAYLFRSWIETKDPKTLRQWRARHGLPLQRTG
jgi:hypothetical protein